MGDPQGVTEQVVLRSSTEQAAGPLSPAPAASPIGHSSRHQAVQHFRTSPQQPTPGLSPTAAKQQLATSSSLPLQGKVESLQAGPGPLVKPERPRLSSDHSLSVSQMVNDSQLIAAVAVPQQALQPGRMQHGQPDRAEASLGGQGTKKGRKQAALERLAGQHPQLFRALQAMQLDASGRISPQSIAQVQVL